MPELKKCAAPGCVHPRRDGQLMCREHWFQLPKPLRDEIWSTYRSHHQTAHLDAVRRAIKFHMVAAKNETPQIPTP